MSKGILVIGGGIAGISASLDLAEQGYRVFLVEKEPSIGGRMAQLDKTFPTLDCSICILAPKMVEVSRHPNIQLYTYSEIKEVKRVDDGSTFKVKVELKPRYVDSSKCTGCRVCMEKCPIKVPSEFEEGMGKRKAIYIPFPQAVPAVAVIDSEHCLYLTKGICRVCERFCPAKAIDFTQEPEEIELDVDSIIVATGFDLLDPSVLPQYGYGRFPNVLTSMQYERLMNAAGPTGGKIVRVSDGEEPSKIAFIQCVGSRNEKVKPYCSQICCTYATKEAVVTKEHNPNIDVLIFYNDLKASGKGHQEFVKRAMEEFGIKYVKGLPSEVQLDINTGKLRIRYADLLSGGVETILVDMVVLCPAVVPKEGTTELAEILGVDLTDEGFFKSLDALSPVDTSVPGIYVCGVCEGPKDISHSVAQASAAAVRAASRSSRVEYEAIESTPEMTVDESVRIGVFVCNCGINIGSVVNVSDVVEYAKTLEGVVYSEEFMFACSKDSINKIKDAIKEHNLNRVIVASCTPRTHEPLFRNACSEAGLNPYLFEMVNIREHDSWVHSKYPREATQKAKNLVKMAVERSKLLKPLTKIEIEVSPTAMVIGGGLSGMLAALTLADMGFKTHLVESGDRLGGRSGSEDELIIENEVSEESVKSLIENVEKNENIEVHLGTEIIDVKGSIGDFNVLAQSGNEKLELKVGTIIVATGSERLQPKGYYSYGENPNVITLPELKKLAYEGKLSDIKNVVLILCVGVREDEGRTYCSATCCEEAIKCAVEVKERYPNLQLYLLYQDVRLPVNGYKLYRKAHELGIIFVRYLSEAPPKLTFEDGKPIIHVEDVIAGITLEVPADKVALASPLIPRNSNIDLASKLKVPLNEQGFFLEAHPKLRPLDFATDGIHLCGTCHSPQCLHERAYQALGAASRALIPLMRGSVVSEAITAEVNPSLCIACGNCVQVCEYGAVKIESSSAEVNPLLCKGCGVCSVECPASAITMHHFTDDQISAMIKAALETPPVDGEVKILAFFCNWCAYAGADTAGVSRFQYQPNVEIIRTMCSGRVSEEHILQAFLLGADGVLVGGCHPGTCHYISGNLKAEKRVNKIRKLLRDASMDPERLRLEWFSAGEGKRVAEVMNEFISQIKAKGASPLRRGE